MSRDRSGIEQWVAMVPNRRRTSRISRLKRGSSFLNVSTNAGRATFDQERSWVRAMVFFSGLGKHEVRPPAKARAGT